jgi:hypothetical protein
MATSSTAVCNLAITWVAGNRITSLADDQSTEAILCRENYDPSRRAVLEEREWTFALKRTVLNPLVGTPAFGFARMFKLPADCLKVVSCQDARLNDVNYVIEDGNILSDEQSVYIRYTYDLDNTNKFSELFTDALAAHIASKIALPLSKNRSLMGDMLTLYGDMLERAISTDSLQGSREKLKRSQQERSRRMFTGFD